MHIKTHLARLASRGTLSRAHTEEAFEAIMTGQATPAQIAALLSMIQIRNATRDEIVGAATVMRRHVVCVQPPAGLRIVDTCGTGGTHSTTFNISTAAGIVAAAAGYGQGMAVAKHGNRSVTSRSGSSEVLERLGLKLRVTGQTLTRCLEEAGFCFCFAPAHHPAMKHAGPVRADLGFRTLFNLLGPLTNPAGALRQVMGVYDPALTELIAEVLSELGSDHAMIVHGHLTFSPSQGQIGLGEITTTGLTRISHLHRGQVRTYDFDARELGLETTDVKQLSVEDADVSAKRVREVLAGEAGPSRDIVCLNAAAALLVGDVVKDLPHGLRLACAAIDDGRAAATLDKVIALTQTDPTPQT